MFTLADRENAGCTIGVKAKHLQPACRRRLAAGCLQSAAADGANRDSIARIRHSILLSLHAIIVT